MPPPRISRGGQSRLEFGRAHRVRVRGASRCEEGFLACVDTNLPRFVLVPTHVLPVFHGPNQSLYTCVFTRPSRDRVLRGSELLSSFTLNRATLPGALSSGLNMADDELDPAFLDLDLPAHASSSLSSLGAEFGGSSLDIDPLEQDDSFEAQLGAGFGAATLGDELHFGGDTLHEFEELDPEAAATRSVHQSRTLADDVGNASSCDDEAVRTPSRQKRARMRTERQHHSLAFELASVARPSQRERTLLRELGLEDDDDDDDAGGSETSDVSASESEGSAGGRTAGRGGLASLRRQNGLAELDAVDHDLASPRRRSAINGRRPISTSLEELADRVTLSNLGEIEQDAKRERALEQDLEAAAANVSDSTRDILDFMSRLRIHVGASSSEPTNSTTISNAASIPPLDYRDRQSVVEDLCSAFLRSLQSSAARRTEQQQDMTGLERELARSDV